METKESVKERIKKKIKKPNMYHVIMLNDDFTTMDFVVRILIEIFHKDPVSAEQVMLMVHKKGKAAVGAYPYDMAMTKVNTAMGRAKAEGFPFRMTIEQV